jgi:hypothetical protein
MDSGETPLSSTAIVDEDGCPYLRPCLAELINLFPDIEGLCEITGEI